MAANNAKLFKIEVPASNVGIGGDSPSYCSNTSVPVTIVEDFGRSFPSLPPLDLSPKDDDLPFAADDDESSGSDSQLSSDQSGTTKSSKQSDTTKSSKQSDTTKSSKQSDTTKSSEQSDTTKSNEQSDTIKSSAHSGSPKSSGQPDSQKSSDQSGTRKSNDQSDSTTISCTGSQSAEAEELGYFKLKPRDDTKFAFANTNLRFQNDMDLLRALKSVEEQTENDKIQIVNGTRKDFLEELQGKIKQSSRTATFGISKTFQNRVNSISKFVERHTKKKLDEFYQTTGNDLRRLASESSPSDGILLALMLPIGLVLYMFSRRFFKKSESKIPMYDSDEN